MVAASLHVVDVEAQTGDLDLRVPERMLLGSDATVEISVEASNVSDVRLFTNVGHIRDVRKQGERVVASYHAPKERYPQVAIVVATSADLTVIDWGSIALIGQPTVKIRYGRRTSVLVRAAGKEFGPVKTDRRGRAELVVEVPPGVESVTVYGADGQGETKERTNALEVPSFERQFVLCSDTHQVFGFAVDKDGKPLRDVVLAIESTVGTRTSHTRHRSGATLATFDVPADMQEEFSPSSRVPGAQGAQGCSATAGSERYEITVPKSFVAGGGAVDISIAPLNEESQAAAQAMQPTLRTDVGELSEVRFEGGVYLAKWTLPDYFDGRDSAKVEVIGRHGTLVDKTVRLEAATVAKLSAELDDATLLAGDTTTNLRVRHLDAYGNPARVDAVLEVTAQGEVGPFERQADGHWRASYAPPELAEGGTDTVEVRDAANNLTAQALVTVYASRSPFLLSARVGYLTNFSKIAGPAAFVGLRYRLPWLDELPFVAFELGGYLSSDSRQDTRGMETVHADLFGVPVMLRLGLTVPVGPVDLFAAFAGGALWSSAEVRSQGSGTFVEDDIAFSLGGFVGTEVPLGPGALVIEAGYVHAARGGTVGGQGMGFVFDLGYGLGF